MSFDEGIQATNDDATVCKTNAVKLKYWDDPFVQYFAKAVSSKAPEINRGYYIRSQIFKAYVDYMIQASDGELQILNLGAGFDTLFFRLSSEGKKFSNIIDLDLPFNAGRKIHTILQRKTLLSVVSNQSGSEVKHNRQELHAHPYHVVGFDLRNLDAFETKLKECDIDFEKPTIILSECVLVYMDVASSSALLSFLAEKFKRAAFLLYEQVNVRDRFGETMLRNLGERGCQLAGIDACESLKTHCDRFTTAGWRRTEAWSINQVYKAFPPQAIQRIERIEHLDEFEVMQQLFEHYCLVASSTAGLQQDSLFDLARITSSIT